MLQAHECKGGGAGCYKLMNAWVGCCKLMSAWGEWSWVLQARECTGGGAAY